MDLLFLSLAKYSISRNLHRYVDLLHIWRGYKVMFLQREEKMDGRRYKKFIAQNLTS